jgi:GNAT superfamily N-acetyltransferase
MTTPTSPYRIFVGTSAEQMAGYREMTYPAHAGLLDQVGQDPTVLAVAAETDEPAGLALLEIGVPKAVLRSIYVVGPLRRRGIGLALLERVEAELRQRGVNFYGGGYPRNSDAAPVEGLLKRAGWNAPTLDMYLFRVHSATVSPGIRTAPWFRPTEVADGTEFIPYSAMSPADLAAIDQIMVRFNAPGGLRPSSYPGEPLDADLSLVLKINQEIFGWSVCHRMNKNWVRFTSTYIRPDCPLKGLGVRMAVETIRAYMIESEGNPEAIATWGVPAHLPMAAFQLRRFVPYMTGIVVTELWGCSKNLPPEEKAS